MEQHCPSCKADLTYEIEGKTYYHTVGIYSQERDRTVEWLCPFCNHRWSR